MTINVVPPIPGEENRRKKIAVVGSGISGASAAWALSKRHDVTLYEASDRLGGHTCTAVADYDGTDIPVDVGFIVFNERNYPDLTALFDHFGVATETSDMSFAMSLDGGKREWCSRGLASIFAQRRNVFSPTFVWMLREILRFNKCALRDRDAGFLDEMTIGEYLQTRKFSERFRDDYLIAMAAAIWSTPRVKALDFPARAFIGFFENHRLLEVKPPNWRTVSGGSRNYHEKLVADFRGRILRATPVRSVMRIAGGVALTEESGITEIFDEVVLAGHSDQSLAIRGGDATEQERNVLSAIPYKPNRVILHRDESFMPTRRNAWASWNYMRSASTEAGNDICVTYWMNRLQNIDHAKPLFVTLNPVHEPAAETVFGEWTFDHPQYDNSSFDAQRRLRSLQGNHGIWYAGAWTGYGFHEDGLRSGLDVAEALGGVVPWREPAELQPLPAAIAEAAE